MEYNNDILGFRASIADASRYTMITPENFIKLVKDHYFPINYDELGEIPGPESENYQEFLNKDIIPLSYLPEEANVKLVSDKLYKNDITSIDFLAYRAKYSRKEERELIEQLNGLKELFLKTDAACNEEPLALTKKILSDYGLTKSKFHDYKEVLSKVHGFSKLLNIHESVYTKQICRYAKDLILERKFKKEPDPHNDILEDLRKIKADYPDICSCCPHNKESIAYEEAKQEIDQKMTNFNLIECHRENKNGLIIPKSESTITRFVNKEGEQAAYLAKTDKQRFMVKYGSKVLRDRCNFVNEVACLDHHQLDLLVKVYNRKKQKYEIIRPWVTMLLDSCSGAIVGSVITLQPNKYTVMECICRAMAVKPNSPICGSFGVIYADNGADMLSDFVSGKKAEIFLNEVLVDNPVLRLTSTKFRRARRKSPNSKPIERAFWTIERRYLSRLPAYIGNKKTKRYTYIRKEEVLDRYIKSGKIWDYDKFVDYWFYCVVPLFNNRKGKDGMSPIERYMTYPKIKHVIPDWTTMSYFLSEKKKCTVTPQGVLYNNTVYDCTELKQFISTRNKKWVRVYDFDPPLSDSIILLYNDLETKETRYIGVAYKKVHAKENRTSDLWLMHEWAVQNWQYNQANDMIAAVIYLTELNKFSKKAYVDYDMMTKTIIGSYYCDDVVESSPKAIPIGNSATVEVMMVAQEQKMKHLENSYKILKKRETVITFNETLTKVIQQRQSQNLRA